MQFLICQQDNYDGKSNLLSQFFNDLILNYSSKRYFYIIHNEVNNLHVHLILIDEKNELTKKDLLIVFPSADIQIQRGSNKQAYEYLTHKNDLNKTQYSVNDIVSYNIDNSSYFDCWINIANKNKKNKLNDELAVLDEIAEKYLNSELTSYSQCLNTYKGIALKYSKALKELFNK